MCTRIEKKKRFGMRCSFILLIGPLSLIGCATIQSDQPPSHSDNSLSEAKLLQAASYREDARSIEPLINHYYAYLDRFNSARAPISEALRKEAEQVNDRRSLLRYAERVLLTLADHHAITGSSLANSWSVVPSYSDLWIVEDNGVYTVDAVRHNSPGQEAGIKRGDRILSIDGVAIEDAVESFWAELGLPVTSERARIRGAGPCCRTEGQTATNRPCGSGCPSLA